MTTWDRERQLDELERESVDRDEWEQHPSLCPFCAFGAWGARMVRDEDGRLWHEDCLERGRS